MNIQPAIDHCIAKANGDRFRFIIEVHKMFGLEGHRNAAFAAWEAK